MSKDAEQETRGDFDSLNFVESGIAGAGIQQGAEYGDVAIAANQTPISVDDLHTAQGITQGTTCSFKDVEVKLMNHSGFRDAQGRHIGSNPSTITTSSLGDCRGKSIHGQTLDRVSSYDYENTGSNFGVNVGLYSQDKNEIQIVFCSTDTPCDHTHMPNALGGSSDWSPIEYSPQSNSNNPSCSAFLYAGENASGTAHPLYISFSSSTSFSLLVLKLKLTYAGTGQGIHEYVIPTHVAVQNFNGSYSSTLSDPGSTNGWEWAWSAIVMGAPNTAVPSPSNISFTANASGIINRIFHSGGSAPMVRMLVFRQGRYYSPSSTLPNLVNIRLSTGGYGNCLIAFYIGAR